MSIEVTPISVSKAARAIIISFFPIISFCCSPIVPKKNTDTTYDNKASSRFSVSDLPAPPSGEWELVPNEKHSEISWESVKQFSWNWEVFSIGENIKVRRMKFIRPKQDESVPFDTDFKDVGGFRKVLRMQYREFHKTTTEWMIGFDHGEFGGSLWWCGEDGKNCRHVADENVIALYEVSDQVIVLSGLSHLSADYGKVLFINTHSLPRGIVNVELLDGQPIRHLIQSDGSIMVTTRNSLWAVEEKGDKVTRICGLDKLVGTPRAYASNNDGSFLVFTTRGLWNVRSESKVDMLCEVDTDISYPRQLYTPIYIGKNGKIYIGLIYYLVKLTLGEKHCDQEWYVPSACPKTKLKDHKCYCTEGRLAGKDCSSL